MAVRPELLVCSASAGRGSALFQKAAGEFGREVLGVGGRTTVAAEEKLAAGEQRLAGHLSGPGDVGSECLECPSDLEMLRQRLGDDGLGHVADRGHSVVHVRTPCCTKERLTSWALCRRSASCTAKRRCGSHRKNMKPPPPAPLILPPRAPAALAAR